MRSFLSYIKYILSIHVIALFILSLFRIYLFINSFDLLQEQSSKNFLLISEAFIKGIWFDNVACCYISILPLFLVCLCGIFNTTNKYMFRFIGIFLAISYLIAFAASAANVPYFEYFFKNINSSIFNWADQGGTTLSIMFGEITYLLPIGAFIVTAFFFIKVVFVLYTIFYIREKYKSN